MMRFRIAKSGSKYFPQVCRQSWDGERWFDDWRPIGDKSGYTSIKGAKLMCIAYKASKEPEVIEEFEL